MRALGIALGVAYPLLVYLGLQRFEPRHLLIVLGLVLGIRFAVSLRGRTAVEKRRFLGLALAVAAVALGSAWWNDPTALLFVPVGVNAALLFTFAASLRSGPSIVETIALTQVSGLNEEEAAYCRTVTGVWCAFFLANAIFSGVLAVTVSLPVWTLYTGIIAYVLVGLLFATEFLYRAWRFRRYEGGLLDPLLARVFPPRASDRR